MMDDTRTPKERELLNTGIEAILKEESFDQELDAETKALLSTAEKLVIRARVYPGAPAPSPQQQLELKMAYRSAIGKKPETTKITDGFFKFFRSTTFRYAAGFAAAVLITIGAILVFTAGEPIVLPGTAGTSDGVFDAFPLILLTVAALAVIVYLIFRRKK